MTTYCVTLNPTDADSLKAAGSSRPGVSTHMLHLAMFRLGARVCRHEPEALDEELAAISTERRARRRNERGA